MVASLPSRNQLLVIAVKIYAKLSSKVFWSFPLCLIFLCYNKYFITNWRSGHPEVFYKRRALRKFAKFTRKHLCLSLFFDKIAHCRSATGLVWPQQRYFLVNFENFLRIPFSQKTFSLQITSNYSSINNSGRKLANRIVNYDR